MELKLNKSTLNRLIIWTSSRFNAFKKSEIINILLKMKPNEEFTFSCGNYSERNNGFGTNYTAMMFKDNFFLRNNNTNKIYELKVEQTQTNEEGV